jgi:hypothetical protein
MLAPVTLKLSFSQFCWGFPIYLTSRYRSVVSDKDDLCLYFRFRFWKVGMFEKQCSGSGSRIRDPVVFWPLDWWIGSEICDGISRIRIQDPGSGNIPDPIYENLVSVFCVKNNWILWCGSGILSNLDPASGMEKNRIRDTESGINIPGPQHCWKA